jgi:hypothetical protein
MSVATYREEVTAKARAFAWDQWTQMGVSGAAPKASERRAADPEALLLFTLEVGRHDPRLFDEVLDWLVLNERLISVQRLRNLCADAMDRALVDATLGCVARWRPRSRLSSRSNASGRQEPQPLFIGLSLPEGALEPSFERNGLLRPAFEPSRKSQPPDLHVAINLAFRLRRLLGIGARAEVARTLLTIEAPSATAAVVQASSGYSRLNTREALLQLDEAGVAVTRAVGGSERLYSFRREDWAKLLRIDDGRVPRHVDWIQTLGPLRLVLRWLYEYDPASHSEYMRASEARVLLERLEADLRFAGIAVAGRPAKGAEFWGEFERTIDAVLAALEF